MIILVITSLITESGFNFLSNLIHVTLNHHKAGFHLCDGTGSIFDGCDNFFTANLALHFGYTVIAWLRWSLTAI